MKRDSTNLLDQVDVRNRLLKVYKRNILSMPTLAGAIGIHFNTLNRFLKNGGDVKMPCLVKILNYVEEQECLNNLEQ
jgi:hypothetical protein